MRRRPIEWSWAWLRPYVPFIVLTAGYLLLRLAVFGQIARESMLTPAGFELFAQDLSVHLRRMVFGESGLTISPVRASLLVGIGAAAVAAIGTLLAGERATPVRRATVYFGIVWLVLGVAPTIVAGYASPRHMYLASVSWAMCVGIAFEVVSRAEPARAMKPLAAAATTAVLIAYTIGLVGDLRVWARRATVSHRALIDIEREALAEPQGS